MFLSTTDYLARPRPDHAWLIKDVLPVGGLGVLYAKAKTGKSFLALDLIEAISNPERREVFGLPVGLHGPVLYLQLDTAPSTWVERVEKIIKHKNHDFSNVYWADRETPKLPYPFNILAHSNWLKEHVKTIKPVLVVIDTIRDCHGGDENDAGVVATVIAAIRAACGSAAILLIGHPKKEQGGFSMDNDAIDAMRGSTVLVGSADTILKLTKKGAFTIISRAQEDRLVALQRAECGNGCWELNTEEKRLLQAINRVLVAMPSASRADQARMLVKEMGTYGGKEMTEQSAVGHLKRKADSLANVTVG